MASDSPTNQVAPSWTSAAAPIVITPGQSRNVSRPSPVDSLRVLHVVNGEHFSGAERVQSHLGRCLPDFHVAADFACVKPGKFAQMLDEENGNWGECHRVPMSNRFDLRAAWQVKELVRKYRYGLLHAHTPRTAMIASLAARLAGVPWVYHVHSPAARDSSRFFTNQLNATIERLALKQCTHLITVSQSLRADCIRRGVSEHRITVVHNGVPAIAPLRKSAPDVGGRWVLGMIALMRPRKGLEVALDAIAQLCSDHDILFRIIGPFEDDAYEQEINARIRTLGISEHIQRVGFTTDVPGELAQMDAMILPSLYGEGLPMVVLESMAAGTPVIATEVEGTPEAVTHGKEGLLAQPRDARSLGDQIRALIQGDYDWQAMSDAATKRHAEHFSDRSMAQQTAEVYRKAASPIFPKS